MGNQNTLGQDILSGNFGNRYYFNNELDSKNPVYEVIDLDLSGRGSRNARAVVVCRHYPGQSVENHDLRLLSKDSRATKNQMDQFLEKKL